MIPYRQFPDAREIAYSSLATIRAHFSALVSIVRHQFGNMNLQSQMDIWSVASPYLSTPPFHCTAKLMSQLFIPFVGEFIFTACSCLPVKSFMVRRDVIDGSNHHGEHKIDIFAELPRWAQKAWE